MESLYCVYCHTNKENGKKYIGITSQIPERRWRNGNGYVNNEYFYRAIQKYGWHNFSHEILYTDLKKSEAERIEIALISEYRTATPDYGYNIERGGNSTEKFTPDIKAKISAALKGHSCSEETRKKISKKNRGRPGVWKGKKMTQEQIAANSRGHMGQIPWNKGRPWTDEEKAKCNGKSVLCVETNTVYRTMHEAAKRTGVYLNGICQCCKGKGKTAGGYHWKYCSTVSAEEFELTGD